MRAGDPRRLTATYKRNGTTCLLAALAVHTGEVTARCRDRNDHETFLAFLKALYRVSAHRALRHLRQPLRPQAQGRHGVGGEATAPQDLHTPTYASWLNQVEICFNIFTREVMRGGVWASKAELIDQIMYYIKSYNEDAAPFSWNYTGKPRCILSRSRPAPRRPHPGASRWRPAGCVLPRSDGPAP